MPRRRSWNERYEAALRENKRVGSAHATGNAAIAGFCSMLQFRIGAVSPVLIYEGAIKSNLTYERLCKMSDDELIELQWVMT